MEQKFKVLWLSQTTGTLKTFIFDDYVDDQVGRRYVFMNTETDKTTTINYDDVGWMITSPYNEM